jgi:hypothetical protein
MQLINLIFVFVFALLASFKFISIILEKQSFSSASILPALMFMFLFGSPQIAWLLKCRKTGFTVNQLIPAIFAVVFFVGTSIYFGYFPGTSRPSWGGEGHFEVPVAFAAECVIAVFTLVFFNLASKEDN